MDWDHCTVREMNLRVGNGIHRTQGAVSATRNNYDPVHLGLPLVTLQPPSVWVPDRTVLSSDLPLVLTVPPSKGFD